MVPPASAAPSGPVLIRDAETETLLRTFASPLFRAAGLSPGLVRILVISDEAINSFVTTGNRMFIHTGLIQKAPSALALVGVIAHETGHIYGGHLARLPAEMRAALFESLAALLIGAAAGVAGRSTDAGLGAAVGGQQLVMRNLLSFQRSQERAADQAALLFLAANQWSARGLVELFHVLEDQEALTSDLQDPYVRTHPLTAERIAAVEQAVARSPYSDRALPAGWDERFRMVQAKLDGFLRPSSGTLARVRAGDPAPTARYARAIALYRVGHIDEGLRLVDGLIAEQPGSPWLHELKGQILFEGGRGRAAIPPYQEAARLAPDQSLIRQGLGRAMVETNDPALLRPAIQELQAALRGERDDAFTWRQLGIAWGRLGDIGQAELALAEEALLLGDIPQAKARATRAEKALAPGPSRLRAQDIENAVKKENLSDDG